MNTADFILDVGSDEDVAVITNWESYTYLDLRIATQRVAHKLLSLGLKSGDRVGLLSANSLFWVSTYLATIKNQGNLGSVFYDADTGRASGIRMFRGVSDVLFVEAIPNEDGARPSGGSAVGG